MKLSTAVDRSIHEIELLEAIRRIIRSYDLHSRRLLVSSQVTLAQLLCLRTLVELGRLTARELADSIHISASTMVGILDRLEGKGLIARRRDADDRRRVLVTVTAAGRKVVKASPAPLGEAFQQHFESLRPTEQAALAAPLRQLADLIEPGGDPVG